MPAPNPLNSSESAYALLSDVTDTSNALRPPLYYRFLIKLLKPLYRIALWRRHQKAKKLDTPVADYKQEIDARFGHHYPAPPTLNNVDTCQFNRTDDNAIDRLDQDAGDLSVFYNTTVWCHAVSLGETNTIAPMLKVMLAYGAKIWITNTTQTGFARTEKLFAEALATGQMVHTFVPVDDKAVVEKFVKHVNPNIALFIETELWANILNVLNKEGVPSVLVNARLSEKSFKNYAKYRDVSTSMMQNLTMIIAQDVDSAKRFRLLGTPVPKIRRADSLKWSTGAQVSSTLIDSGSTISKGDITKTSHSAISESTNNLIENNRLIAKFAQTASALDRPVWVAGSTHEGEDEMVLEAHKTLIQNASLKNALLIIVPRHPERFDDVAALIQSTGLNFHRRSLDEKITQDTQVYLADTMGELTSCYALSDVAFVGGSLVNIGGHNPIEASSLAKPVVMGPYTQSCHEVVEQLHQEGALSVVEFDKSAKKSKKHQNSDEAVAQLVKYVSEWLSQPELATEAGKKGQALAEEKQVAMQNQLSMIQALLADHLKPVVTTPVEEDMNHFEVRQRSDDGVKSVDNGNNEDV